MGMMMAMNHDSGHVADDIVHPQAGEGGRPDPGEHRLVERQAQGGSDCPPGLVWSSLSSLLPSSAESPRIVRTFYETKVDWSTTWLSKATLWELTGSVTEDCDEHFEGEVLLLL